MSQILLDFPIKAPLRAVFQAISTPAGLDQWWTLRSAGVGAFGAEYELGFGPEYDWRARVTRFEFHTQFELELTRAQEDWLGTRVGFSLLADHDRTLVSFRHTGWSAETPHFRTSSCCWALYLRILRRHLEFGESVPYEQRLDV